MIPLVLIPGMMCDARLFTPQIAALSGDIPLHLAPINRADTVPTLAAEILANAPPVFALAGLSMGGIVAMEILRQAPERVAKIALLDTNPLAEKDAIKTRRLPQIKKVQDGQLQAVMRDEMTPNYLADGPHNAAHLELCMEMALGLGPAVFERQSRALMTRPDQTDTLRAADIPALILCGAEDKLCPVFRHEFMQSLMPRSTLHIVQNAGHLPTLEQPEETTEALRRWLEAA